MTEKLFVPPKTVTQKPKIANKSFNNVDSKLGKYERLKSLVNTIIPIFHRFPRPGTCFKGKHKSNTSEIIAAVAIPIDQDKFFEYALSDNRSRTITNTGSNK